MTFQVLHPDDPCADLCRFAIPSASRVCRAATEALGKAMAGDRTVNARVALIQVTEWALLWASASGDAEESVQVVRHVSALVQLQLDRAQAA